MLTSGSFSATLCGFRCTQFVFVVFLNEFVVRVLVRDFVGLTGAEAAKPLRLVSKDLASSIVSVYQVID